MSRFWSWVFKPAEWDALTLGWGDWELVRFRGGRKYVDGQACPRRRRGAQT